MWEAEFVLPVMMGGDDQACLLACLLFRLGRRPKKAAAVPSFFPWAWPTVSTLPPCLPACLPACLTVHIPHTDFATKRACVICFTLLTGCLHSTRCTNRAIRCPPSSSIPNRPEKFSVVWITLIYLFLSLPPPPPNSPFSFFFGIGQGTRTGLFWECGPCIPCLCPSATFSFSLAILSPKKRD
jgi:hypothetical protein